jgi:hypothetical protein
MAHVLHRGAYGALLIDLPEAYHRAAKQFVEGLMSKQPARR